MSSAAQPSVNRQSVPITREQLEDERKSLGPRAYIAKDENGVDRVHLKRRREVKAQEKTHPAQNWAPDSLSNTKRPKVWPTYECISCGCDLPSWAVGPETQCGVCSGRDGTDCECDDKSDDESSDDESVDRRPHHSEGSYINYDVQEHIAGDDAGSGETCGYCSAYTDSCSQVTVLTRFAVEAIFCNFTCLMRMGVQARDALDEDQK